MVLLLGNTIPSVFWCLVNVLHDAKEIDAYLQFFSLDKDSDESLIEEWTPESTPGFTPFEDGKGMCPGRFFARNEMKICLAMLLGYMDYKCVDPKTTPTQKPRRLCIDTKHKIIRLFFSHIMYK